MLDLALTSSSDQLQWQWHGEHSLAECQHKCSELRHSWGCKYTSYSSQHKRCYIHKDCDWLDAGPFSAYRFASGVFTVGADSQLGRSAGRSICDASVCRRQHPLCWCQHHEQCVADRADHGGIALLHRQNSLSDQVSPLLGVHQLAVSANERRWCAMLEPLTGCRSGGSFRFG